MECRDQRGVDHSFRLVVGVLFVGTVALYSPVVTQEFVAFDDGAYVTNNPLVVQGLTFDGVLEALTALHAGTSYWHPLTWVSHQLDYTLFGAVAGWHKLVNVILHCHNTLLLFGLLYRVCPHLGCSAAVAALFAWHPLHVESVVWVSERKDVLSTFFGFLTFHCYLDYCRDRCWWRYGLMVLLFACAVMSKPMVVTLPVLLLLLDYWLFRVGAMEAATGSSFPPVNRVWEKVPLFLLSIGVGVLTVVAQVDLGIVVTASDLPVSVRIANALHSYWMYSVNLLVPFGLAVRYPYPMEFSPFSVCGTWCFFVGCTVLALAARFRRPYLTFGWAWYVISLLPAIGLIQTGMQARADRYTYVPMVGLFVILVWGLNEWISSRRTLVWGAIVAIALLVYVPLTWRQIGFWKDSRTLFRRAVAVTQENGLMHRALAESLDWKREPEEAWYHLQQAMRTGQEPGAVFGAVARFHQVRGNLRNELVFLRKAVFWEPNQAGLLNRLAYIRATHPDAAVRDPTRAVELAERACSCDDSGSAVFQHTLAAALAEAGDFQGAIRVTVAALKSGSGDRVTGFRRRLALYRAGKPFRDTTLPRNERGREGME